MFVFCSDDSLMVLLDEVLLDEVTIDVCLLQ